MIVPLPRPVQEWLTRNTHPGLMLDKYVQSWDERAGAGTGKFSERVQKPAIEAVVRLSQNAPPNFDFAAMRDRRRQMLDELQAVSFGCRTVSPLTLHLARASALENAGICLHPIYGFVYLPGSGLKGMARAFAEMVWKPSQNPDSQPQATIEAVFGNKPGEPDRERQKAGAVVFHDAWPMKWPALTMDILNNHHAKYYGGDGPPGDWDSPVPVYFLALPSDVPFEFALSKRNAQVDDQLVDLARTWLLGALCHLGAGAKTNSGYGSFRPDESEPSVLHSPRYVSVNATVQLVTPAFLAGADQRDAISCDLRGAALRGLLRWWWRTLHAGFLDVATLRSLEATIWGDTRAGGSIRVEIVRGQRIGPTLFNFKDRFEPKPEFKRKHGLSDRPNQKTTQGLFYAAYGMDEMSRGEPNRRFVLEVGSSWSVRLIANEAAFCANRSDIKESSNRRSIARLTAQQVLEQASAALWLLCNYGGVGSKSRKGFGSLQIATIERDDNASLDSLRELDDCRKSARELRESLGLDCSLQERAIESSALGTAADIPGPIAVEVSWDDPWKIMDEIGFAYQAFAQSLKHDPVKAAMGLPRKIHGPRDDREMPGQTDWRRPQWLDFSGRDRRTPAKDARYASPIHIHVGMDASSRHVVRAIAFPASNLPDRTASTRLLTAFLEFFEGRLRDRSAIPVQPTGGRPDRFRGPAAARPTTSEPVTPVGSQSQGNSALPSPGRPVDAELLPDKTKKGGWRARHIATQIAGPIQNSDSVPADKKPGDQVTLIVRSANAKEIAFWYPSEEELAKSRGSDAGSRQTGRGRGGPQHGGSRGR